MQNRIWVVVLRRVGDADIQEQYIHGMVCKHGLKFFPVNCRGDNPDCRVHGKAIGKAIDDALMVVQDGNADFR